LLSLGDELGGVKAGNNGFEDFISDGGEHTLVVILAEVLRVLVGCVGGGGVMHTW
jgi:hypothetical protein